VDVVGPGLLKDTTKAAAASEADQAKEEAAKKGKKTVKFQIEGKGEDDDLVKV